MHVDEKGKASLIKGVAKDRRISVEDGQMRHGRKSRSVRVDGYKRHVLHDLDSGLIRAVGLTPANAPEASVTPAISQDLERQEVGGRWRRRHLRAQIEEGDQNFVSPDRVGPRRQRDPVHEGLFVTIRRNGNPGVIAGKIFKLEAIGE